LRGQSPTAGAQLFHHSNTAVGPTQTERSTQFHHRLLRQAALFSSGSGGYALIDIFWQVSNL
jgi:hypothetical protein